LKAISVFNEQGLELGVGLDELATDYTATIFMTIQRQNLQGGGLVNIDNLDVKAICCNGHESRLKKLRIHSDEPRGLAPSYSNNVRLSEVPL
jgi:hypothetical protein